MKQRKTPLKENIGTNKNRYRLNDTIALKLGLTLNKDKRYRLKDNQKKQLFEMDIAPIKRLFFDIETSPYKGYFWNAYPKFIPHEMVEEPMKVICISYKWQEQDKINRLNWQNKFEQELLNEYNSVKRYIENNGFSQKLLKLVEDIEKEYLYNGCDKYMIGEFTEVMNEADEIIAHNGDRYDIRVLRTRAVTHRIPMFPNYRTLDTLKKLRSNFKFFSNRLDAIAKDLGVGAKIKHDGWHMWERCMKGDLNALGEMGNYCDGDIIVLEDVYLTLQNYIKHNTHAGSINGKLKHSCPNCASEEISLLKNNFTPAGTIKRLMECNTCGYNYEISNSAYRNFLELK